MHPAEGREIASLRNPSYPSFVDRPKGLGFEGVAA